MEKFKSTKVQQMKTKVLLRLKSLTQALGINYLIQMSGRMSNGLARERKKRVNRQRTGQGLIKSYKKSLFDKRQKGR